MAWAWNAMALADCPPPPPETTSVVQVQTMGVDQKGRAFSNREALEQGPISLDLDHDGVSDLAVPIPARDVCPSLWTYALWRTRGACVEPVGQVVGRTRSVSADELVSSTVQVVATGADDRPPVGQGASPPDRRETTRTYRFDGTRFTLHDSDLREGTCHHCSLRVYRIED